MARTAHWEVVSHDGHLGPQWDHWSQLQTGRKKFCAPALKGSTLLMFMLEIGDRSVSENLDHIHPDVPGHVILPGTKIGPGK